MSQLHKYAETHEVTNWAFDTRMFLAVPPCAEHQTSKVNGVVAGSHPDMPDRARALDVTELNILAGVKRNRG